jgi:hypothetical protein
MNPRTPTPRRPRINKPKKADELLKILREFMDADNISSIEQEKAWNVLSALRGPDTDRSYELKRATTTLIRSKVFGPRSRLSSFADLAQEDSNEMLKLRCDPSRIDDHFSGHAKRAFWALGMSFSSKNKL